MEREYKLDFLRALAILGVLVIHSAGKYVHSETERMIAVWFTLVTSPCIAVFLFVSGALFKQNQDISYLKHRITRVLYPYLLFSIFALIYNYQANLPGLISDTKVILFKILTGGTFNIYFFVFVIIFMYIIIFLLDKFEVLRRHTPSLFIIALVVNLLHASYSRRICDFLGIEDKWRDYYYYRALLVWLPYYFLGIWYQSLKPEKIILENKILIRVTWGFAVLFYSFIHLIKAENIGGYHSVIGTIYSLATILFLLTFDLRDKRIHFISKISYSIYLSHIFFVYVLRDVTRLLLIQVPFGFSLVSFIISFIGALLVYYIAKFIFKSRSLYIIGA